MQAMSILFDWRVKYCDSYKRLALATSRQEEEENKEKFNHKYIIEHLRYIFDYAKYIQYELITIA